VQDANHYAIRMIAYVLDIRLKEAPVGFRVLSAEAKSIESLPEYIKKQLKPSMPPTIALVMIVMVWESLPISLLSRPRPQP
jgi:hypothetical protein